MGAKGRIGLVLAVVVTLLAFLTAMAADQAPLRSGEVVEVLTSGIWSWIGARDADGEVFWVMASNCTVGKGGRIEVLRGTRYGKIRVESLGRELDDCYTGDLVRIDGKEIEAYGAHGLPSGCIDLGG